MGTIKRIITVETLDDVADAIAEQVTYFHTQVKNYELANDKDPGAIAKKHIIKAQNIRHGLRLAESIVRDCQFAALIGKGES